MKTYKVILTERASEEYSDAFLFYENEKPGMGSEFETEVEKLTAVLSKNPFLFARKYKRFREALTNRFPFFLVYEIIGELVVIHSVFHTSRNPEKKSR